MTRYWRRWALAALTVSLTGCGEMVESDSPPAQSQRPNILLIVADDLGYTDLGAFGGEIRTPNLDLLALAGLRLTNFHTAPSCAPTRAMLMTGTDNHLAGMGSQGGLETERQAESRAYLNKLLPEVPTVTEHLAKLGYRNLASAKWHLGHEAAHLPNRRGFHRSFVLLEGGGGHFDNAPLFERYGQASWLEDDEPVELPEDFYSSDFMTDKLLSYIDETPAGQPYFAFLGYTAPHWPLQAPAEDVAAYGSSYQEGWDELRAQRMQGAIEAGVVPEHAVAVDFEAGMTPWAELSAEQRQLATKKMQVYAGMVSRLDQNVGRLLQALARRGDLSNTVIIFLADNGAEAHPMELYQSNVTWVAENFDNSLDSIGTRNSYVSLGPSWARATAAPFRASKSKISEGGIRVPAFVKMPGLNAGIDTSYMRVMDLAPTFIELAGGEVPEAMMGRSLLPRLQDGTPVYSAEEFIAAETYGRRMVKQGDWKLLLQAPPYGTGDWQLYNLTEDLGEQNDLSDQYPERRAALIAAWQRYADNVGVINPEVPIRY